VVEQSEVDREGGGQRPDAHHDAADRAATQKSEALTPGQDDQSVGIGLHARHGAPEPRPAAGPKVVSAGPPALPVGPQAPGMLSRGTGARPGGWAGTGRGTNAGVGRLT